MFNEDIFYSKYIKTYFLISNMLCQGLLNVILNI